MTNLWETIESDDGNTVADSAIDTLTIAGGKGIKTKIAASSDTVTIDISPTVSDETGSEFTLLTEHDGYTFTNKGATQMITFKLPAAVIGYSCSFVRVTGQTVRRETVWNQYDRPWCAGKIS